MNLTPSQTLAGWIVFAQQNGESGAMLPSREVLERIVKTHEGRYDEAEALADRFVQRLLAAEPETALDTGAAGLRFVKGVDKLLGGIFSAPPVKR